jgi:predicted GH43/DUF377 family glycosyl hydrolase
MSRDSTFSWSLALYLAAFAWLVGASAVPDARAETPGRRLAVLDPAGFRSRFGEDADWAACNVPLFDCPDREIGQTYDFRWRVFKKHIRSTPDGFVITEFLPDVSWAGKHNTISCAAGHHIREGRWLCDPGAVADYLRFWFRKGGEPRRYSFWAADSVEAFALAAGDWGLAVELLPDLVANYEAWERTHRDPNGLFWQSADRDGMEFSIGGDGCRPTINSYLCGDAAALARIAARAGRNDLAERFRREAATLRALVESNLWDPRAQFYKTLPRGAGAGLVAVREEIGFVPWYFNLPAPGHEAAWAQLVDPRGFAATFGPTTAERRHPGFMGQHNHECLWNGPSWPFATTQTLVALANLLNDPRQRPPLGKAEYLALLASYARSQRLRGDDGTVVPWIDEDLDPDTGRWLAREILRAQGRPHKDRGRDYNHSGFCDLVITGLAGLRPRADDVIEVNPLLPAGAWNYFCLDGVPYHGRTITICYDESGEHYHRGAGLRLLIDGREAAASAGLARLTASLSQTPAAAPADAAAGWRKSDQNPVLGGELGTCFDVSVLKEGGTYRMWFSWRPRKSVALVESADGIHWSKPVIVLGPDGATGWEDDINRPVVVRRPDAYHMWYTGQAQGHSKIGYATSPDGKTWTRTGAKPVLEPEAGWEKVAVMCPHVLWDDEARVYRMWYSGGEQLEPDAIGYATSTDGQRWSKHSANPIFRADPDDAWERHKVTGCQVVRQGDWYLMFYIGFRDIHHAQMGVARSRDGIGSWQRLPANPILRPGRDQWDADAVYKPFAILEGTRWRLWYNGRRGDLEQIGLAEHEGADLGFEPARRN